MKSLTDCFKLSNGVKIPCLGLGTWQSKRGKEAADAVTWALRLGYRHIDTAAAYGNEHSIGAAIARSGVKRDDIFVTSKLNNPDHGYEQTLIAFEKTLKELEMDYLDLYLIHWPNPMMHRQHWQEANAGTWKAFEELYEQGKIRSIGVSNFLPHHLEELLKTTKIVPMVNQIRLCPGETQDEVVRYCREKNILLEAYSPLGTGKIFEVHELQQLAAKYGKSVAQICIRWSLQMGLLPLPKSVHFSRIDENAQVFDFTLDEYDMKLIENLNECVGNTINPDETDF